jgi:hypothetical protein
MLRDPEGNSFLEARYDAQASLRSVGLIRLALAPSLALPKCHEVQRITFLTICSNFRPASISGGLTANTTANLFLINVSLRRAGLTSNDASNLLAEGLLYARASIL